MSILNVLSVKNLCIIIVNNSFERGEWCENTPLVF